MPLNQGNNNMNLMALVLFIYSLNPNVNAMAFSEILSKHCSMPFLAAIIIQKESGFRSLARGTNKNKTTDIGLFQINSIHGYAESTLLRPVMNIKIGCEMLESHKSSDDPYWPARFHSKTPSEKIKYWNELHKLFLKGAL